jgi:hypothetical protein
MRADVGSQRQLKELVARIKIEKDPEKFTELIKELNRLIDGDRPAQQHSSSTV